MNENKENLTPTPKEVEAEVTEETVGNDGTASASKSEQSVKFDTEGSTVFVKHEYNTKKPVKNGWKKRIGICAVALLLCGAIGLSAFLVVKLIPTADDGIEALSSVSQESITVLKFTDDSGEGSDTGSDSLGLSNGTTVLTSSTEITGAGIYNAYEEYAIMPYTEEGEPDKNGEKTGVKKWYIPGIEKHHVLSDELYDHIKNCLTIRATAKMENTFSSVEEYHKAFGLDEPTRAFVATFADGTEIEILVGSQTASDDANYLTVSGDDTVYIVSSTYIVNYDYLPSHFADLKMVDAIEQTDDNAQYFTTDTLSRFDYIKISGTVVGGRELEFGMSTGVSADYMPYMMLTPYHRPAAEGFLEEILAFAENGIEATDLYSFNATEENREICGFNDPGCVIEVKIGDYEFKLTVGGLMSEEGTGLSAMVEGKQQIFSIDAATLDFLDPDLNSMFNQDFIMENITTIDVVTFEDSTGKHSFDLAHTKRTDAENAYDSTVKYKGKSADITSFKSLYQRVLLLSLLSFVTEAEEIESVLTITFEYIEDYEDKVVKFTESPSDTYHYIAWVDGVPLGEVLKSSVTDITKNLAIYVEGGTVPSAW